MFKELNCTYFNLYEFVVLISIHEMKGKIMSATTVNLTNVNSMAILHAYDS